MYCCIFCQVPECDGNKAKLDCPTCKGFKGVGIFSHVLAINHIQGKYDLVHQLKELSATKANNPQGSGVYGRRQWTTTAPALQKQRLPREPDSSDEEEQELRRLTV